MSFLLSGQQTRIQDLSTAERTEVLPFKIDLLLEVHMISQIPMASAFKHLNKQLQECALGIYCLFGGISRIIEISMSTFSDPGARGRGLSVSYLHRQLACCLNLKFGTLLY